MSLSRSNPVAIEVLGDRTVQLKDQIEELVERVKDTDNANATWMRKQVDMMRQRFGKRKKKRVPWKGASNVNVPMTDGIVRRWRPGIAALILDANPVAFFRALEPSDLDPARTNEPFFSWLFVEHMDTPKQLLKLVDIIAQIGHGYAREGWSWRTDRAARVVSVAKLFPEGLGSFLERKRQTLQSAAAAVAQDPSLSDLTAEEATSVTDDLIIMRELAMEYGLDVGDPEEREMLAQAAREILQGAEFLKLVYETLREDRPDWRALNPLNTIYDQTGDPETGDFFVIIHDMDANALRRKAKDGFFLQPAVAEIIERMSDSQRENRQSGNRSGGAGGAMARQQMSDFFDRRAGIHRTGKTQRTTTPIWECYCHLDVNRDELEERCVLWYSPEFDIPMGVTDYVMPFPEWPITLFLFEPQAERPVDSRGIPELLNELQKLVNSYHNARVDASQIVLAPVIQKRSLASDYAQKIQWRPGAVIDVQNVGDVAPLTMDLRILQGLFQEQQINQAAAESFIGTFDATINQLNQPAERRTAAEVNAITQLAQNVFGLDARMFQNSMARSFRKIWKLWMEFGPEEVFFRVMGEEQPVRFKKSEVDLDYDITPAGTPSSTNKAFLLSAMERILQIVIQDQSGRFDLGALLEQYFKLIDVNIAKVVVRTPEQTQAAQVVQQAAQQVSGNEQLAI